MKHHTHIYIAGMAILFLKQAVDTMGLKGSAKAKARRDMKLLQQFLYPHRNQIEQATWDPDDVLHDNHPCHVYKLASGIDFPDHPWRLYEVINDRLTIYSGNLPDRVVDIANRITEMTRTRNAGRDIYPAETIAYQYLLLSHYVADAHVPNHCDLRDDPPAKGEKGKPSGTYLAPTAHAQLEELWEQAVTPVAIELDFIRASWAKVNTAPTELTPCVTLGFEDCKPGGAIKVNRIPEGGLRKAVVKMCVESWGASHQLFPEKALDKDALPDKTRSIFARAISDLIAVWGYCWNT